MTDYSVYYNEYYDDKENKVDMKFLLINKESSKFYNFGINVWLDNYKSVYDDFKMFFSRWIETIDSLLLNNSDNKLNFDGQGSFMCYGQFEIEQTADPNMYILRSCENYSLVITRNTLEKIRDMFQYTLTGIDTILRKDEE